MFPIDERKSDLLFSGLTEIDEMSKNDYVNKLLNVKFEGVVI